MAENRGRGRGASFVRDAFEPTELELIRFGAQDVITTSNPTGIDGEEFNIFGNPTNGEGGEQA